MKRSMLVTAICGLFLPCAALAETGTFRLFLGSDQIGTMSYDTTAARQSLSTDLNNTPMSIGDGRFFATSVDARRVDGAIVRQYLAESAKRTISVLFDGGKAIETTISPISEETALSEPATVPAGVLDPVAAVAQIVTAGSCPAAFRIYDGRRAIRVVEASRETIDNALVCHMDYRVTDGPGHLSPFRFRKIGLDLVYNGAVLTEMTATTALFTLNFKR